MAACGTLEMYRDMDTDTVYVLAGRDRLGVHLRDLDSEPGDLAGIVTWGEWDFWAAVRQRRIERIDLS